MRLIFTLLIIAFCIGSNSCQKEFSVDTGDSTNVTTPNPADPGVTGNFTAKIDGVAFTADKAAYASIALGVIAISGQDKNGQTIILRVADSGVHVYTLDINSMSNAGAYTKDSAFAYVTNQGNTSAESGGTLSITSINITNKTISGTFTIKVYRALDLKQLTITEGVFTNLSYTTEAVPPAAGTDTFRVKIDGADMPVYSIDAITYMQTINLVANNQQVSKTVGLTFPSEVTPGVYEFTFFDFNFIGQYNVDGAFETAENGTLTILENNKAAKRVRGTFNFHAKELLGNNTAELTEGYFSVGY